MAGSEEYSEDDCFSDSEQEYCSDGSSVNLDLSEKEGEQDAAPSKRLEVDDMPIAKLKTPLLSEAALLKFKETKDKTGVVYMSRVPPNMTPSNLRQHLAPFGAIGRVFLAPNDKLSTHLAKKTNNRHKKTIFTEGWVEFLNKKHARTAAEALNGRPMASGRRGSRFREDLWCLRYLGRDFKWSTLTERVAYESAVREQRLRQDLSQAKRENKAFLRQVDKAHENSKIAQKRAAKATPSDAAKSDLRASLDSLKLKFRQRKPVNAEQ